MATPLRFRLSLQPDAPPSSGLLGGWYFNLLNVGRARLLLSVSERALLPVLVPARNTEFPARVGAHLRSVLAQLGVPPTAIEAEVDAMGDVAFAPTRSRQILGVFNDFAFMAETYLRVADAAETEAALVDVALHVAESPSKPIGYESPERMVQSLFGAH